ncbi:MAG: hypothetical protein GY924_24995 [Planctomycetaceae bacterium]|nr:hypothetical protein [Planctomycetaceae bacterium]
MPPTWSLDPSGMFRGLRKTNFDRHVIANIFEDGSYRRFKRSRKPRGITHVSEQMGSRIMQQGDSLRWGKLIKNSNS